MILLQQGITNVITVSLTEKQVGDGSIYLLKLVNDTSKEQFYTVLQDVSDDRLSYNTFYLPVTTGSRIDSLSGSLSLPLPGFYSYSFYQGTGSVNPTASLGLLTVETGKAQLLPANSSSVIAYTSSYSPSPVYNPADYNL